MAGCFGKASVPYTCVSTQGLWGVRRSDTFLSGITQRAD
ncbi:protein of unknown function (plasmid) [Streptantibioticus cattleyicolor NRRL 8057 = DSM 46488]|nr:protein of unknown function [Streptantibioticus cattleyicolor NRRL 8057 = DSM 46488]